MATTQGLETFVDYVKRETPGYSLDDTIGDLHYDIDVHMREGVQTFQDVMVELVELRRPAEAFVHAAELYAEYIREQQEG
jgi:hypothetical protein